MNFQLNSLTESVEDYSVVELTKRWFEMGRVEMNKLKNRKGSSFFSQQSTTSSGYSGSFLDDDTGVITETSFKPSIEIHYSDLRVLTSLGEGVSSYVNKVVHIPSGEIMAIKVFKANKEKDWMTYLCRELTIMRYSYSPYFLEFYGATVIDGTRVVMLMEYMDLGSLECIRHQLGGRISERILGRIARPLLNALFYLHQHFNILHRDVKPANILLNSNGDVKLSDFGVSQYMDPTGKIHKNIMGSRDFMSPECIGGEAYGELSDIWSLGVTLYVCATGHLPYNLGASYGYWEIYFSIRNDSIPPLPYGFSDEFRDFIQKCLERDVSKRPSIPQLLVHPFIKKYWDVDLKSELECLIHKAVNQNELDLDKRNDETIIQVIREKESEVAESEVSEDATTPLSVLQDISLSIVEIPHVDQPPPAITYPERFDSVIIPQVALNVYQQMQKQIEEEQVETIETIETVEMEYLEEGNGDQAVTLQTLCVNEEFEDIPIQDVTIIPPDTSFSPTFLNTIHPLLVQTQEPECGGHASEAVSPHSIHSSDGEFELSDFSPAGTPRFEIIIESQDSPKQLEEPREDIPLRTHVIYPYLLKHTNTMLTDDLVDEMSLEEEGEVLEESALSLEEIEDPLFMYPKLSSEKKLLHRMFKPKRSWKQKIIRRWNRFVRSCIGKKKKSKANRRCCW